MGFSNWGSIIAVPLQNMWYGVAGALSNIVGALIILILGVVVANVLGMLIGRVVKLINLDKLLSTVGVEQYFRKAGVQLNSSVFFQKFVYWFFVVVFILAAADVLGFQALSEFLRAALLYVPNVIVAVLIMLAAVVIGNFLRHIVRASVKSAELHAASFLGTLTWWSVVLFGFFAALSQLGIAVAIINSLVTGFVAMLAIAGGLAFGLGGKEYASHLISQLRDRVEH